MADHRFERTDADIRRAFIEALTDHGFEKLNVAELARRAQVDRTTFYAHFDSLYTLAERVITDEIELLRDTLQKNIGSNVAGSDRYQLFSDNLIDQLSNQADTIQKIRMISLGIKGFDAQCRQLFSAIYQQVLGVEVNSFTDFLLVNMAMSDLDFILRNHRAPAREELVNSLNQLAEIATQFK